jgi:hypothetical protein
LAVALCLGASKTGEAAEPRMEIELASCDALRADDVRARLAIELPVSTRSTQISFPPTVVHIECSPNAVRLSVTDPITMKGLTRTIELRDDAVRDIRTRTVAIAIAELIAASWIELEANPKPRVPGAGPKPPAALVREAVSSLRRARSLFGHHLRLEAVASTQVFFSGPKALWGGGLRLADDSFRVFGWAIDLLEHHGGMDTMGGRVAIDTLTVGASAVAHREWRYVGVRGGLGFRLGATILRGLSSDDRAVHAGEVSWAAGGPFGMVGAHVVPVRGFVIDLAGEGGYWLFPTGGLVNGRREVAVEGPWLGVQLGFGIVL